ncbi:MAG: Fic family protein [Deltaproteobacteria bacterium]|nr:Fic family protein [Deltaproteobacteria bacterium]
MRFLERLSNDIKKNLLEELRVLWTHTSTSIEGNTLTLGETAFVLSEGLTIHGKPLKDHRDIQGHARAVDLLLGLVKKDQFTAQDIFDLHCLAIDEQILDVYKPVGAWKKENNSTNIVFDGKQTIVEFSNYWEVPELMSRWLDLLNAEVQGRKTPEDVLRSYVRLHLSFISIHPFWDGNGRIARLVSNLPCFKSGYPPIIIEKEKRYEYITAIADYQLANGVPSLKTHLVHEDSSSDKFYLICKQGWEKSQTLVEQAHNLQQTRNNAVQKPSGSRGGENFTF